MVDPRSARRWLMLAVSLAGQASVCAFSYGLPMLVPALRQERGLSLTAAAVVVGAPSVGLLLTLVAWGAAADRWGERWVMAASLALGAAFTALAATMSGLVGLVLVLGLAGAAGAAVNSAGGRLVMGWFAPNERGLAMGIRQTAQPLGVALAALVLPGVAHAHGLTSALLLPAGLCALVAVAAAVLVVDPVRPERTGARRAGSPYRQPRLWRVHATSALLVVPQFAVAAFTLVYLVDERGWSPIAAGHLVFVGQVLGGAGRIAAGVWSDRVGSRMEPVRQLAVASTVVMAGLALGAATHSALIIGAFLIGAVITVADNGLAFTAVAEIAGPGWAGRAMGIQNTGQNLVAGLTPVALAAVIGWGGYGWAFAVAAVLPLSAIAVVPADRPSPRTLSTPCAESLDTSEARTPSTS